MTAYMHLYIQSFIIITLVVESVSKYTYSEAVKRLVVCGGLLVTTHCRINCNLERLFQKFGGRGEERSTTAAITL